MRYGLETATFLVLAFAFVWVGKLAYGLFWPAARVDRELTARDNLAFAVPLGAYYLGILLVMGVPLSGPSRPDFWHDVLSSVGWGLLAILVLNVASIATDRLVFRRIDLRGEVLERGNLAAGTVLAGSHLACALITLGALADEGGPLPGLVFWLYALLLLGLGVTAHLQVVRYDVTAELHRGNQAVALTVAGVLVAMGNVLRLAITGPFQGWTPAFGAATGYALAGLVLLFVVRRLTDWLLLPGVTIRQEIVEQEVPNVGVGYLEALIYLGASFLVGWTL